MNCSSIGSSRYCTKHKERYDVISDEEWYISVKV